MGGRVTPATAERNTQEDVLCHRAAGDGDSGVVIAEDDDEPTAGRGNEEFEDAEEEIGDKRGLTRN